MRSLAAVVVVLVAARVEAQPVARLTGRVLHDGEPVEGAIVMAGDQLAATDAEGTFTLTLAPGRYALEVSADWIVPLTRPIELAGDGSIELSVSFREDAAGEQIEVVDIAPTQIGETRVDAALARAVPGGGDAAKVVQALPAVARPPAGSAEIVVWGAAPRDTRVFVDGVPVPSLYHLGGYRAAVGNDLVNDIRLTPAAFGPARGRAIGGVIDIGFLDPRALPRMRAQADVLDGTLAGSARSRRWAVGGAIRQSWLDRAVGAVADPRELAPNAPLPRWSDAQLAVRGTLSARTTLSGWVIGSLDQLDRTLASDDPATRTTQSIDQRWVRAQVTLRRDHDRGQDSATVWFGRDRQRDDLDVGTIPARQRTSSWVGGGRAMQQRRLDDLLTLTLGLDLDAESARLYRAGSLTIPAREGDLRIFGQPPGDDTNTDRWTATTVDAATFATLDFHAERVTATLGTRVDGWLLGASRLTPRVGTTPGIGAQDIEVTVDPRASVQVRLSDSLGARADVGRYHQARAASDTSAVFGTPDLGLEQAWHATLGGQWTHAPFAIEVAGYGRLLDDLVARDLAVTPLLANSLTQGGDGRVVGMQLTARVVGWRGLSGWLSYGLSRSTRKDAESQRERYFDRDQTHGLIAVGGWQHGPWNVGARLRFSTGEPRTNVLGSFFDARSGRYQPIRGAHNGVRLPAFFGADLRGERRLVIGRTRAAIYAEVQNLTGRANPEEIIYNADYSARSYLTGLPLLAIAGMRIER